MENRESPQICFACGRIISGRPKTADTRDAQFVHVGPDCYKKIVMSGKKGYQPPTGGPRG